MSSDSGEYQVGPDTTRHCPNCNAKLLESAVLCVGCGYDLRRGALVPTAPIAKARKGRADARATTRTGSFVGAIRWFLSTVLIAFLLVGLVAAGLYFTGIIQMPRAIVGSDLPEAVTELPDVASPSETEEPNSVESSTAAGAAPTGEPGGDGLPKSRTWSDSTGEFKVEAIFASCTTDVVVLRKADGSEIKVPIDRLSEEDRNWLELRVK